MSGDGSCSPYCQVIEDVAKGWDGFCYGLVIRNRSTTAEWCSQQCCQDLHCQVWQFGILRSKATSSTSVAECYGGMGIECASDRYDDFLVYAGQRISHGTVTSRKPLEPGRWCTGGSMHQVETSSAVSDEDRRDLCNTTCEADPSCTVWEYSTAQGCWSGASTQCDLGGAPAGASSAASAGEELTRECGKEEVAPSANLTVVSFTILSAGALLLFIALAALVGGCCRWGSGTRSVRRSKHSTNRTVSSVDSEDDELDNFVYVKTKEERGLERPGPVQRGLYVDSSAGMYQPLDSGSGFGSSFHSSHSSHSSVPFFLPGAGSDSLPPVPQMRPMRPPAVAPLPGATQMVTTSRHSGI